MPPIKFLKSDTDENEAKNAQIQAAYSSYADTSTWHGIPDLFVAKSRFVKIFWVLVLLSSCGMLIYQMYNVIDDYSQEPHYSTSLVAVVLPNGVPFPNVTVCNLIRASKSKLFKINMTTSALSFLYASLAQYYKTSSYLLDSKTNISILSHIKTEFNKFASQFDETSSDPAKIFDYIGHDCNDTLIKCWWTGIDFDCCQYSKAILTAYGKCYSITPPAGIEFDLGVKINRKRYTYNVT